MDLKNEGNERDQSPSKLIFPRPHLHQIERLSPYKTTTSPTQKTIHRPPRTEASPLQSLIPSLPSALTLTYRTNHNLRKPIFLRAPLNQKPAVSFTLLLSSLCLVFILSLPCLGPLLALSLSSYCCGFGFKHGIKDTT